MARPKKKKDYKINEIKNGTYRVKITYKGVNYVDMTFDKPQYETAIKSIDITILKHRLPYNTKGNYRKL